jgi:hypothetical protein
VPLLSLAVPGTPRHIDSPRPRAENTENPPRIEYSSAVRGAFYFMRAFLPVRAALLPTCRVAYNPQFVNTVAHIKAPTNQEAVFAPVLDMVFLRVHRKFNQNLRKQGQALLLGLSTTVSRITRKLKPFLYDEEYYVHNPHPYDAEAYLPAAFIQGCQHVMEHMLNRIWGDDIYNGLTSERKMLTDMFIKVLQDGGLDPLDVNRASNLMDIREQLELYLLNSGNRSIEHCILTMLAENPQWIYAKDLADCMTKWTNEGIPKNEFDNNVKEFVDALKEEILSEKLIDDLEKIGKALLKFRLTSNAKQVYEKELFERVLQARKTNDSLEGLPDIPTNEGLKRDLVSVGAIGMEDLDLKNQMFKSFPTKAPPKE